MKNRRALWKGIKLATAVMLSSASGFALAEDIKFSGFLSVGGGFVDDEKSFGYNDLSEEDITIKNNIFGLQASGTIAENVTATGQFIARGANKYAVNSEWAYVTYQVSDSSKIRAGRLRTPFYQYSDFLDVGYAYSWISPPHEVYYLPFNNVDGVDYYTSTALGSFDTTFQAYFGSFDDSLELGGNQTSAKTRNQMGVATTLGKDWWTLRAAYHQAKLQMSNPELDGLVAMLNANNFAKSASALEMNEDKTSFAQIGGTIDTGTFVAAAEHIELDATNSFLGKHIREYVMVGVRTGNWLFNITTAKSDDELSHAEDSIPAIPQTAQLIGGVQMVEQLENYKRDVTTLGARWDVTSGTAVKFQFDSIDANEKGKQKVYSFAVQTVF